MKQIKFISSLFFLVLFISCSENSNSLVNPENNLDKKGISQVTGGGDALTLSSIAYNTAVPAVIATHVVTMEDIWTRGGGSNPMSWSVYSTYVGEWDWAGRVYVNETPPTYIQDPVGNPLINGNFGYTTGSISSSFLASAGDVIHLWIIPLYVTGGGQESSVTNSVLQKLNIQGTGTLHLD